MGALADDNPPDLIDDASSDASSVCPGDDGAEFSDPSILLKSVTSTIDQMAHNTALGVKRCREDESIAAFLALDLDKAVRESHLLEAASAAEVTLTAGALQELLARVPPAQTDPGAVATWLRDITAVSKAAATGGAAKAAKAFKAGLQKVAELRASKDNADRAVKKQRLVCRGAVKRLQNTLCMIKFLTDDTPQWRYMRNFDIFKASDVHR